MAEFLTTSKSLSAIEDLISQAKDIVVLISPYVQIPERLFRKLKDASAKGVEITLVYGKKEELQPGVKEQLARLDNVTVRFRKTLHAKCFFNEEQMVITSMNLYDFSEKNDEMGILLSIKEDENLFKAAREEANSIVNSGDKVKIKESSIEKFVKDVKPFAEGFKSLTDTVGLTEPKGHCISCGKPGEFNTDKPLCKNCYPKWRSKHKDPNFLGEYCHKCGNQIKTTMARPLCNTCYNKK